MIAQKKEVPDPHAESNKMKRGQWCSLANEKIHEGSSSSPSNRNIIDGDKSMISGS